MTGKLLNDIWPLLLPKPKEKEKAEVSPAGERTKFYRDRNKKKKAPKPPKQETRKPYGNKGEKVEIIAIHGNVYIVQGIKERFPVHENDIEIFK